MARPPAEPPRIGGFSYVKTLGSGGFADVFLYEQAMPRRRVAVKVLLEGLESDRERRVFEAEANLMAQLSTHPSIVTIYEADIAADGRPYIAMEYCGRPSLDARFRRERISVEEALRIGIQVAGAVETAHRAGILHRDIKPANILVTDYNNPALTDFGIAGTLFGEEIDEMQGMSVPWSPPEVFGAVVQAGTTIDIYALGATVYSLLAGRSPFEGRGLPATARDIIARIRSADLAPTGRPDVPASLEAVLARCMEKLPGRRYATALDFARALQTVQSELGVTVTTADVLEENPDPETVGGDDEIAHTRLRALSSTVLKSEPPLDAEQTVLRASVEAAPPAAPDAAPPDPATVKAPPRAATVSAPQRAARAKPPRPRNPRAQHRRHRRLALGVWAALMVVLSAGSVLAVIDAHSTSADALVGSARGADVAAAPALAGTVPPVAALTGTVGASGVVFTWMNPEPQPGDRFVWGVVSPGVEADLLVTTEPSVTLPADPNGRTCIGVFLARAAGSSSNGATACTE